MGAPSPKSKRAARLIIAAIGDLQRNRPNMEDITKHITQQYHVPETDIRRYVSGCIERGIAFGAIKRDHGRYELGDAFREWSKKPARPRKGVKVHKKVDKSKGVKKSKFKCCCGV